MPLKPLGKVLLVLDGLTLQTTSVQTLEFFEINENILYDDLGIPLTIFSQGTDFFVKSLKHNFYSTVEKWNRLEAGNIAIWRASTRYNTQFTQSAISNADQ